MALRDSGVASPVITQNRLNLMTLHRSFVALLLGFMIVGRALAHDPGLSSANITRTEDGLKVTLTFAWLDLASLRTAATASDSAGIAAERPASFGSEWQSLVKNFVQVVAEGSVQSAPEVEVFPSTMEVSDVVVALAWSRLPPTALRVELPVIKGLSYAHRMILTLGDAPEPVALLRERLSVWELPPPQVSNVSTHDAGTAPPTDNAGSSWPAFVLMGVEHILIGFDHLCFLLALLIVATRLREIVALISTFTVAHSLTLAAAALNLVSLSPRLVEPLIALSIVYIGIENLVLRRPPRYRLAVAFGFGLIHGLGFASVLGERLPGVTGSAVVPLLLDFNLGVELGQLAVAACLVPLIKLARAQPKFAPKFRPAMSLAIAAAGMFWLIQRV